jgi:hypothetical protein
LTSFPERGGVSGKIEAILIMIGVLAALPAGIFLMLWMHRRGERTAAQIMQEAVAEAASDPSPSVDLSFTAYQGCLHHWVEHPCRLRLPYDTADLLLRRLHWYTLRWAWLGPAAIILPWSIVAYHLERRRLRRQLPVQIVRPLGGICQGRRSLLGYLCLVLVFPSAAAAVAGVLWFDFNLLVGGTIAAILLGWIACQCIQRPTD